jgi:Protein of unknown function (DUF2442)
MPGNNTLAINPSAIEVSLVSNQGFWLLAADEELFLAYADFPWFKEATIAQITNVQRPSADHLYWPSLDIDLSVESVRDPSKFPLISKVKSH